MESRIRSRRLSGRALRTLNPCALKAAQRLFIVVLGLFTLSRVVLTFRLETTNWAADPATMLLSLGVGFVNDLATALVMSAIGYGTLVALGRRGFRTMAHIAFAAGFVIAAFGAVAEVFFWDEFASRFNGIAVFYLIFPREVIGNLHESFDLELLLPPIVIVGLGLWWWSRQPIHAALTSPPVRWLRGTGFAALGVSIGLLLSTAIPANVFENRELNEIALNGPANMVRAALTNDSQYDGVYPGIDEGDALSILRAMVTQDNTTFVDPPSKRSVRRFVDNGDSPRRLNIVLVIEESFGSIYVDALDSRLPKPVTPELTRLANDGLFFTNVYASGNAACADWKAFSPHLPQSPASRRCAGQARKECTRCLTCLSSSVTSPP